MTRVERDVAVGLRVHVILDNYATHKTSDVAKWLRRHPRLQFHFTPTTASWLNLMELLLNEPSRRRRCRLAVNSVAELIVATTAYLDRRNEAPTPFVWTVSVRSILAKGHKANKHFRITPLASRRAAADDTSRRANVLDCPCPWARNNQSSNGRQA
jgi:hypothetical protein